MPRPVEVPEPKAETRVVAKPMPKYVQIDPPAKAKQVQINGAACEGSSNSCAEAATGSSSGSRAERVCRPGFRKVISVLLYAESAFGRPRTAADEPAVGDAAHPHYGSFDQRD